MKTKRLLMVLCLMLLFSFVIGFFIFPKSVLATTDIDYTFANDNRYNDTISTYDNDFNIRNATIHYNNTDTFPATYSFTSDAEGSDPEGWDVVEDGGTVQVIDRSGHDNVIELDQDSDALVSVERATETSEASGTFEFWLFFDTTHKKNYVEFGEDDDNSLIFWYIGHDDTMNIYSYYSSSHNIIFTYSYGIWYHFKIDFDCATDDYDLTVNGILEESNVPFHQDVDGDFIAFNRFDASYGGGASGDAKWYIDAIGFSWDTSYNIGDNIYSYNTTISNTSKEVNAWEFAYEGFEDQYDEGSDIFSDWTEIDTHDTVNIATDPLFMSDRRIHINHQAPETHDLGITREFDVATGLINVSWGVEFISWGGSVEFCTKIYSSDDTLIFDLYIESGQLRSDTPAVIWDLSLDLNTYYEFNVLIDHESIEAIIILFDEGVLINTFIGKLITGTKDGLGKLDFYIDMSAVNDMELYLDYVGVYVDGSSISTEFAYIQYDDILGVGEQYWYFQVHSLFNFDAIGNFSIYVSDTFYPPLLGDVSQLTSSLAYYNGSYVINVFDVIVGANSFVHEPMLWFQFYNSMEMPFNFSINGVILTDGTNDYSLDFSGGNISNNESYFYVDDNSYLSWTITFNDNDTEYIQANFDIIDFYDDNYSMYLYGYEFGNGYGYSGVNYADSTSASFQLPTGITPINNYLNQQKDVDEIVILITDTDEFSSGVNTGAIRYISFRYVSTSDLTLATLSLTNVMLNLIIVLIPSLLFYYAFDKKRDVLLISMVLMLTVSFATSLIPVWLFFLGLMCMGMFLFIKTEGDSF